MVMMNTCAHAPCAANARACAAVAKLMTPRIDDDSDDGVSNADVRR